MVQKFVTMRGLVVLLVAAAVTSVTGVDVWWKSAVVYQIYPRSFMDSTGDGIGDLNGITSKLWYLKDTGVDAIWLSPIYKSPMNDFGYDITDYRSIAEEYGTMADFDALLAAAKSIGIRVVLDFVPNHTSLESEWFKNSEQRIDNYTDYYIWADGRNATYPPSNWISVFRKSAWEYSTVRQQYFLHQFVVGQPDLNYRNPILQEEMRNVLRFWLTKGVSGFRIDAVNYLFEADPALYGGLYPNEPLSNIAGLVPDDYDYVSHIYSRDQNDTYDVIYDWRSVLNEFTELHNESKIMMTEAYAEMWQMMRYYGDETRDGSLPFNFNFLRQMSSDTTAPRMKEIIEDWMNQMPAGKVANWVNGNHDNFRMASRYGVNRVDAMNMLALILPGVTITYQGEELGMTDGHVSWLDTKDPQACNTEDPINYWKSSRDPGRTPFHWDSSLNAGFSSATSTWLPVASNYETVNVAAQMAASTSHYKFYKDVVALKHTPAISSGNLSTDALSDTLLVVTRSAPTETVVGIINLSDQLATVNLLSIVGVPDNLEVVASGVDCTTSKWVQVEKTRITMSAHCALALRAYTQTGGNGTDTGGGSTNGTNTGGGSTNGTGGGTTNGTGTETNTGGGAHRFLASYTMYTIAFILVFAGLH